MAIEATGEVNLESQPETPEVPPPPPTSSDGDDQSWNAGASLNLDSASLNLDLNKAPNVVPTPAGAPTLSETPPVAGSSDSFLSATPSALAGASTPQGEATTATVAATATATAAVGGTALSSIPIGTAATVAAASASAAGEKTTAEPLKIETAPMPPSVADLTLSTAAPSPATPAALASAPMPEAATTATSAVGITALSSVAGSIPIGTAATVAAAVPRLSVSNIQSSADPNGEANRPPVPAVSTIELVTAQANGATTFTDNERSRLIKTGVDPREMGKSDAVIASLPKDVSELTNAQLGTERAAVKNFAVNADNTISKMRSNPENIDSQTRGSIFPQSLGLNSDGTLVTKNNLDPNNSVALSASTSGAANSAAVNNPVAVKDGRLARITSLIYQDQAATQKAKGIVEKSAFGRDPVNRDLIDRVKTVSVERVEGLAVYGVTVKRADTPQTRGQPPIRGNYEMQVRADLLGNPGLAAGVILHETVHVKYFEDNPNARGYKADNIQMEVAAHNAEMKLWKELRTNYVDKNGNPSQTLTPYQQSYVRSNEKIYRAQQNGGDAGIKKEIQKYPAYRDLPDLDAELNRKPGPTELMGVPYPF
jgi:hypothetical protein